MRRKVHWEEGTGINSPKGSRTMAHSRAESGRPGTEAVDSEGESGAALCRSWQMMVRNLEIKCGEKLFNIFRQGDAMI